MGGDHGDGVSLITDSSIHLQCIVLDTYSLPNNFVLALQRLIQLCIKV